MVVELIVPYVEGSHGFLVEKSGEEHKRLIRCKDCKYGSPLTDSAYYVCTKPFAEPNNRRPHDWYCADAERKDGE